MKKLFGMWAVAARQLGIGIPLRGQGSICQLVPEARMKSIEVRAKELASAASSLRGTSKATIGEAVLAKAPAAPVTEAAPTAPTIETDDGKTYHVPEGAQVPTTRRRMRGKRHAINPEAAKKIIYSVLRATKGQVKYQFVIDTVHNQGWACTHEMVAEGRRALGYPTDSRRMRNGAEEALWNAKLRGLRARMTLAQRKDPVVEHVAVSAPVTVSVPMNGHAPGLAEPETLPVLYLRRCVEEWNKRVAAAVEVVDLATDPLRAAAEPVGKKMV